MSSMVVICFGVSEYSLWSLQDRFQQLVPTLNKWGTTTVGFTLIAIGVLGLLEGRQQQQEQLQLVTPQGSIIPSGVCRASALRYASGNC